MSTPGTTELLESLREADVEKVDVDYSGSGDEGFINEIAFTPSDSYSSELEEEVEEWAYGFLEDRWPGWEVNEGSSGDITIEVGLGKATVEHSNYYIESEETTLAVSMINGAVSTLTQDAD